ERAIESEEPPVRGKVDLIFNWLGETVGEIKTTKQEAFTILKAEGKPRYYQVFQLFIYMMILKIRRGMMIYENNNTGEMLFFPVYLDEETEKVMAEAFEWMTTVKNNEE